jgi:hypothetical protein
VVERYIVVKMDDGYGRIEVIHARGVEKFRNFIVPGDLSFLTSCLEVDLWLTSFGKQGIALSDSLDASNDVDICSSLGSARYSCASQRTPHYLMATELARQSRSCRRCSHSYRAEQKTNR